MSNVFRITLSNILSCVLSKKIGTGKYRKQAKFVSIDPVPSPAIVQYVMLACRYTSAQCG